MKHIAGCCMRALGVLLLCWLVYNLITGSLPEGGPLSLVFPAVFICGLFNVGGKWAHGNAAAETEGATGNPAQPKKPSESRYVGRGILLGSLLTCLVGAVWGYIGFGTGFPGAFAGVLLAVLPGLLLGLVGGIVVDVIAQVCRRRTAVPAEESVPVGPGEAGVVGMTGPLTGSDGKRPTQVSDITPAGWILAAGGMVVTVIVFLLTEPHLAQFTDRDGQVPLWLIGGPAIAAGCFVFFTGKWWLQGRGVVIDRREVRQ